NKVEALVGVMCEPHLDGSNFEERLILRNTTFRDIIIRNINFAGFPQNIWSVQPLFKIDSSQTFNGNGWFGMGFNPDDNGMKNADFIIGFISNGNNVSLGNYKAVYGGYHPPTLDPNQDPELESSLSYSFVNNVAVITFKRALSPKALIDFYSGQLSSLTANNLQMITRAVHGGGMFITW
ncbi:6377_t:CDS:2, partial [Cetraspora pellucida]